MDPALAPSRHIVANLDVESHWQRLLLPHRAMPQLGRRVLDLVSAYGTLLRAASEPNNPGTLWTPAAVDRSRLTPLLPVPRFAAGARAQPASFDLGWGVVDETVARVNHRRFAFELAAELGVGLPGAVWIRSLDEALSATASLDRWVAKAPLSASGRDRVIGADSPDEPTRRRLSKLLARSDGLLVEPWKDRTDDFGTLIEVKDDGCRLISVHRQVVGQTGAFVGIDWPLESGPWIDELVRVACSVGDALFQEGYRGPASIDAWTWRQADGSVVLNPLGEINARLSFGWVARQIGLRLGREQVSLRLGSGRQMAESHQAEALLLPNTDGRGAAWLETTDQ